ncbi:hypothetical protein TWF730_003101 [Orbilia blumenaviensis]|uniref:Uncharacterized protein n=1 Tax=Orbilia blumenaviensis TaxID=1796055 RepID=A0AAV9U4X8_9PEZI
MATPGDIGGGKGNHKVLPFVISSEYGGLPPAKLSLWKEQPRCWFPVLDQDLNPSVRFRYAIRNSGIHIMAIRKLDHPDRKYSEKPLKPQFGRISSLVFGKPPDAGPILYNAKKVAIDPRRPAEGRCLRLDFRTLDGGLVFGVEIPEAEASTTRALASDARLALDELLNVRTQILASQNKEGSIWLRLETSQLFGPDDDPLTILWSSKNMWLGVNERVLPWADSGDLGVIGRLADESPSNSLTSTPNHQVLFPPLEFAKSPILGKQQPAGFGPHFEAAPLEAIWKSEKSDVAPKASEVVAASDTIFTDLGTSISSVIAFYWEPRVQNWTRIVPASAEASFSLSLNFQLLPDGIELGLLHQVPVPQCNIEPSRNRVMQLLGSIKWYTGDKLSNVPYHIRMRDDGKDSQLPVFYINLPELFEMKTAGRGGQIFDSMIDVAHQIFIEAKTKTERKSLCDRWICIKTTNTQNQDLVMEILQCKDSAYFLCSSTAVPRRPRITSRE